MKINVKKIIALLVLTISAPALADEGRVEFCPGEKLASTEGTARKLENFNLGDPKYGGTKLVCKENGQSYLFLDHRASEFAIDSYETCEKIQKSMDANPKNAYLFMYDKYERSVIYVELESNRICDDRNVIHNKQGTRLEL
jgi:hypothetical protein